MTFMTTYQVFGTPQGKARPRFRTFGKFVQTYTPQKTRAYEDEIAICAREAMGSSPPLETPVSVYIYIAMPVPQSYSKKRREACLSNDEKPIKKPDADNVAKAFLDSMNGIVYLDDSQVTQLFIKKTYESVAKVHVLVKEDLE